MQQYRKNLGKVSLTTEGAWDRNKSYEILSIVYEEHTQHGFISRKAVPVGVDINNKEYWMPFNVSGYADNNMIILNQKISETAIKSYTLEEAVKSIASVGRKPGAILGFYNENTDRLDIGGRWELWQYNGIDVADWENVNSWDSIYYNYNKFVGWYRSEEALKKYIPFPEIGCYAYVGSDLNEAVIYRCDRKYVWTNTTEHAWDYIKVIVGGNVTVGENGNWFNNGVDTNIPASVKGENGKTPIIRNNNNVLEVSYDNLTWTKISDEIAAWFRWQGQGGQQAFSTGKIQITRDGVTWTDLSGEFVNNLRISRYIGTDESLPTSGIAEGTIYAKGPTYADEDTSHSNPIYRLWVYAWKGNTLAWQDNGEFQSIAAGVVQETGDGEGVVMSQKAVTEKLSELGSKVLKIDNILIKEFTPTKSPSYDAVSIEVGKKYRLRLAIKDTLYTLMIGLSSTTSASGRLVPIVGEEVDSSTVKLEKGLYEFDFEGIENAKYLYIQDGSNRSAERIESVSIYDITESRIDIIENKQNSLEEEVNRTNVTVSELYDSVSDIETDNKIKELSLDNTENLFDIRSLLKVAGILLDNGVVVGKASLFNDSKLYFNSEANKSYTFSGKFKTSAEDSSSGNGLILRIVYTDGTATIKAIPNSTSEFTFVSAVSDSSKTIDYIAFGVSSGSLNTWYAKELQVNEGNYKEFIKYNSAVDYTARQNVASLKNEVDEMQHIMVNSFAPTKSPSYDVVSVEDGKVYKLKMTLTDTLYNLQVGLSSTTTAIGRLVPIIGETVSSSTVKLLAGTYEFNFKGVEDAKYLYIQDGSNVSNQRISNISIYNISDTRIEQLEKETKEIKERLDYVVSHIVVNSYTTRNKIYGISINNSTGIATRVADAIGLQNDWIVGVSYHREGSFAQNDFDNIFPWCDIKLCNVSVDENGYKTVTYQEESSFRRDGSNGEVMVEIPKFYTMRKVQGDIETICISGERKSGFVIEPAFFDSETGEELEYIYVAAYMTQIVGDKLTSRSGLIPDTNEHSLSEFRAAGEVYDIYALNAIQKLFSIEFGSIDSSSFFGGLSNLTIQQGTNGVTAYSTSDGETNTADFYSNNGNGKMEGLFIGEVIQIQDDNTSRKGHRVITSLSIKQANASIVNGNGKTVKSDIMTITFSGEPIQVTQNVTFLYATAQINGLCDDLTYHTGRTVKRPDCEGKSALVNSHTNQFRYRNMEGLWGNIGEYVEGVMLMDLKYHICNKRSEYGNIENYTRLPFNIPEHVGYDKSTGMVREMLFDRKHTSLVLPIKISEDGSGKEDGTDGFYNDYFNAANLKDMDNNDINPHTPFICIQSMAWDGAWGNGLYMYRFIATDQRKDRLYGTRMIYRSK